VDQISRMVSQERTVEAQLANHEQLATGSSIVKSHLASTVEVVHVPAEGILRFRTALPEAQLADLLGALIQGGVKVTQFREVQSDLEEAFMSFARPEDGGKVSPSKSAEAVVEGSKR
jgi:ABC-2 type transport system ATP-binding protein